jgi:6-phosphogluconolactonase
MKRLHIFLTLCLFAGILIGFNSCQKENSLSTATNEPHNETTELWTNADEPTRELTNTNEPTNDLSTRSNDDSDDGAVFVMSNATDDNKVLAYKRAENGMLTMAGSFSTGGKGTGGGLGSQNALLRTGNYLYACNAGSNDFTVFKIKGSMLAHLEKVASQGTRPISITAEDELVYVLNAGGNGNIAGFNWGRNGHLAAIQGSVRPLSTNASGPAQIQFNPSGRVLVVTEKATNKISTYEVGLNGVAAAGVARVSDGMTPFGFAFTYSGRLIVSNAAGGAANKSTLSSYNISSWGDLRVISSQVPDKQSAACWVVVSNDNRYCYTTNTGSGNISGYRIDARGGLTLLNADGVTATTGGGPIDFNFSENGRYLYTLNGKDKSISIHRYNSNGGLTAVGTVTGLPMGAVGIAAK